MQLRTLGCLLAGTYALHLARRSYRQRVLPSLKDKTVVITGGARGLGFALTRLCLEEGARASYCSRTAEDLASAEAMLSEEFPKENFLCVQCDVQDPAQVDRFIQQTLQKFQTIDVLINNAGSIEVGPLESMTREDFERSIATHLWGPYQTINAALPALRASQGSIANIASIGGRISVPHLLPYSAGKFALVGYSEGLAHELVKDGISVTTVCPGLMRTGSAGHAWFKVNHQAEHAWFSIAAATPFVTIRAEEAARQIMIATLKREAICNFPWTTKLAVLANSLSPNLTNSVLKIVNELLPKSPGYMSSQSRRRGSQSESGWSPSLLTLLGERAADRLNEKAS